ncbi:MULTISPECIES: hypothetical protein [unclassified Variovorax]|jgi:hypothetical protein|uniref:hypothetical protein n=1 Tax=unclassified Variovorax TaxID=663243 RepID=UPI000D117C34|nr:MULTISPECIES: hypothetical protein [unclassified Variovorax]AVQ82947.1 hypothetical protein C4F17_19375 [Variovorax sp. PMC12]QRY32764.1 hypothetical protein JVX96_05525 [Variovorax sp. PDNC026]
MDEPLQLRFRLAPEDAELLGEAALERRLAEHDRQSERLHAAVQRLVPRALSALMVAAPVLAIGLLYALEPRPVRAEFWISSAVAVVLSGLLWLFRARLVERIAALGSRRRARTQPARRDRVARALHRSVTRSATRAVGIHEVTISAQGLSLMAPQSSKAAVVPWQKLTRIEEGERFYRLYTQATERFGLSYLVARHSSEMDAAAYEAGLQRLLALSPVTPVPRSSG